VVLDACGVGATGFRDQQAAELLDAAAIDIIKGNASEIARLAGEAARTRGVDAGELNADLKEVALRLAQERQATVVITGAEDVVTDGRRLYGVKNGDLLMGRVVGTGCMAASVIGAFAAVSRDYPVAAAAGLSAFGVAAQGAARKAQGPGSFKELLFDHLYHLDQATLDAQQRVEEMLRQ
jgi:hydroxyethylthiazole kinase